MTQTLKCVLETYGEMWRQEMVNHDHLPEPCAPQPPLALHTGYFIWILGCSCLGEPKFGLAIAEPGSLTSLPWTHSLTMDTVWHFFIFTMFPSHVPCTVHYTLMYRALIVSQTLLKSPGTERHTREQHLGEPFGLSRASQLGSGMPEAVSAQRCPSFSSLFFGLSHSSIPAENLFVHLFPQLACLCPLQLLFLLLPSLHGVFLLNITVLSGSHDAFLSFQLVTQQTFVRWRSLILPESLLTSPFHFELTFLNFPMSSETFFLLSLMSLLRWAGCLWFPALHPDFPTSTYLSHCIFSGLHKVTENNKVAPLFISPAPRSSCQRWKFWTSQLQRLNKKSTKVYPVSHYSFLLKVGGRG